MVVISLFLKAGCCYAQNLPDLSRAINEIIVWIGELLYISYGLLYHKKTAEVLCFHFASLLPLITGPQPAVRSYP